MLTTSHYDLDVEAIIMPAGCPEFKVSVCAPAVEATE